jgi:hypothetical protein
MIDDRKQPPTKGGIRSTGEEVYEEGAVRNNKYYL